MSYTVNVKLEIDDWTKLTTYPISNTPYIPLSMLHVHYSCFINDNAMTIKWYPAKQPMAILTFANEDDAAIFKLASVSLYELLSEPLVYKDKKIL